MYRKGDKVGHRIGPTPLALSSRVQKHWKAQIERSSLCIELFRTTTANPDPQTVCLTSLTNFQVNLSPLSKKKKKNSILYNQDIASIILLHFPIINLIKKKEKLWFLAFISSWLVLNCLFHNFWLDNSRNIVLEYY